MSAQVQLVTSSPKVRQRRDRTRRLLLMRAGALFLERGFENVSVEDILEVSGVARSTFYRFFNNRESLLAELVRPVFERGVAHLRNIHEQHPRDCLSGILQTYLSLWDEDAAALRVAARVGGVYFSLFEDVHNEFRRELVRKVERLADAGLLLSGDADYSARLIARVAIPTLEVFSNDPDQSLLFLQAMRGLLVKPEV